MAERRCSRHHQCRRQLQRRTHDDLPCRHRRPPPCLWPPFPLARALEAEGTRRRGGSRSRRGTGPASKRRLPPERESTQSECVEMLANYRQRGVSETASHESRSSACMTLAEAAMQKQPSKPASARQYHRKLHRGPCAALPRWAGRGGRRARGRGAAQGLRRMRPRRAPCPPTPPRARHLPPAPPACPARARCKRKQRHQPHRATRPRNTDIAD